MWDFAGDYIRLSEDIEQKQNLLNSASTAWNIGNLPHQKRKEELDKYIESFRSYNDISETDDLKENMELLIENKVKNFDHIKKQILNAEINEENGKFRITIASAKMP